MSKTQIVTGGIADDAVSEEHLDATAITGSTELAATPADTDEILISDAGTLKRIDFSLIKSSNTPYFHVYKSADQTISNATFTTVTFDTELYDSGSAFASNTFTAPSTGYYFIYSQLVWNGTTDSNYSLNRLMKNGSAVNWNAFFQTDNNSGFGGRVLSLSASDTVLVQCYQSSGGNLDLRGSGEDECQFGGYKLAT